MKKRARVPASAGMTEKKEIYLFDPQFLLVLADQHHHLFEERFGVGIKDHLTIAPMGIHQNLLDIIGRSARAQKHALRLAILESIGEFIEGADSSADIDNGVGRAGEDTDCAKNTRHRHR